MMNAGRNNRANKTALITGITGGIGRAIALQFARDGWDIIGQYHSSVKEARNLEKAIGQYNVQGMCLRADFTSKVQLRKFVQRVGKRKISSHPKSICLYSQRRTCLATAMPKNPHYPVKTHPTPYGWLP